MAEIKCPKCGTTFKVDDSSYADILNQVRGAEFENELHKRLEQEKKQAKSENAIESAKLEAEIEKLKGGVNCPSCNTLNNSEAVYCNKCGARLDEAPEAEDEAPEKVDAEVVEEESKDK